MAEIICYYIHFPPNLTRITYYTYLLNADVLNFYPHWIYYNQIAQIWCKSEDSILSRQLSCVEATARHIYAGCPETIFVCFNRTALWRIQHKSDATPSLCWIERRETRRRLSTCVNYNCAK